MVEKMQMVSKDINKKKRINKFIQLHINESMEIKHKRRMHWRP